MEPSLRGPNAHMSSPAIAREHAPPATDSLFNSFWMGGFECATHRRHDGKRLDCIASTRHDELARQDYERLQNLGIQTARDGVRWYLCEPRIGFYDWSSVLNQIRASRETGTQIIWDLFHYGWPDDLNIFSPLFVETFGRFAGAFARLLREEGEQSPIFAPVNEISFFAWGGGDAGFFNPYSHARGDDIKRNLVRSTIASIEAIWEVFPGAHIVHPDPIINVLPGDNKAKSRQQAAFFHDLQFWSLDMIGGLREPELGGKIEYLDIIGANYYPYNQWQHPGGPGATIAPSDPRYRPLSELLVGVYERFKRPILLSETGIEFDARPQWMHYIGREARAALRLGVPLQGVCWYPIVNHPGWDNDRHCLNGLWDYPSDTGERAAFAPMEQALLEEMNLMSKPENETSSFDMSLIDRATTSQGDLAEQSREKSAT